MSGRSYLSIGEVLTLLQQEFPDVTISKIRFLESQGLVNPERTPSGYRKFYEADVERLRWVLRQQREHFLPLKVIKGRLDQGEPAEPVGALALAGNGTEEHHRASRRGGQPLPGFEPPERPEPTRAGAPGDRAVPGTDRGGASRPSRPSPPGPGAPAGSTTGSRPGSGGPPAGSHRSAGSQSSPARPSAPAPDSGTTPPPRTSPGPSRLPGSPGSRHSATSAAAGSTAGALLSESGAGARPSQSGAGAASPGPGSGPGPSGPRSGAGRSVGGVEPRGLSGLGRGATTAPAPTPASGPGAGAAAAVAATGQAGSDPVSGPIPASGRPSPGALPVAPAERSPVADLSGVSLTLAELAGAAGLEEATVGELESFGLLSPRRVAGTPYYDEEALTVARLAAGFARYGVEPRHLRLHKLAAEREAGFIEQVVLPLLKQRNPESRRRAQEQVAELQSLGQALRACLLRGALRDQIGG